MSRKGGAPLEAFSTLLALKHLVQAVDGPGIKCHNLQYLLLCKLYQKCIKVTYPEFRVHYVQLRNTLLIRHNIYLDHLTCTIAHCSQSDFSDK
jgi:hypothetical protein